MKYSAIVLLLSSLSCVASDFPTGKFQYLAKGYKGDMVITAVSACKTQPTQLGCLSRQIFHATIQSAQSASGNDCDLTLVEEPSARIQKGNQLITLWTSTDEDSPAELRITFNGKQALIDDSNIQSGCGMQGTVIGRWIKK